MTSFGRTYERELKGSYSTGMPSLLYLFYNAGHMNDHFRALVPVVVGDYEPPEEYKQFVNLSGEEGPHTIDRKALRSPHPLTPGPVPIAAG